MRSAARSWAGLAVLLLPIMLVAIDATVLGFAVAHISQDLTPSGTQLLWIVDVYSFVLAGLLVTMGTLGDRVGRRRVLLIGCAGFGAVSVLAAYAPSAELLIVARALLGVAGATLMPTSLGLIRTLFPEPRRRTLAIAIWASTWSVGAAVGPVVGGWLLQHFWWGSVFLLNPPVVALVLLAGPLLLPSSRAADHGRFDVVSAGLSLAAMLLGVYGVKTLAVDGISGTGLAAVVVGLTLGVAWVRRQRRQPNPMIDVRLFADRRFSTSVGVNFTITFVFFGTLFCMTQYLQIVLGLDPLAAGLVLAPGAVVTMVAGIGVVRLLRRVTDVSLIVVGLLAVAVAYATMTQVSTTTGVTLVVVAFVLAGAGFGLVDTLTIDIVVTTAPADEAAAASAISETAYEVGAATGTAILGTVLTAVYSARLGSVPAVPEVAMDRAAETIGGAWVVAGELDAATGDALRSAAADAFVAATHVVVLVSALVAVAAAVAARRMRRAVRVSG